MIILAMVVLSVNCRTQGRILPEPRRLSRQMEARLRTHPIEVILRPSELISSPMISSPTEDPDLMEGVQGLEIE